ncbi:MAG: transglutaminase-like domain-containing protein [Gammaproteobacteria bacterium]
MEAYLKPCRIIDFTHPEVAAKAAELRVLDAAGAVDALATAQRCFEFVRDHVAHSGDIRSDHVTLKASDVLAHGTGWCFAKSHLLAALFRANGLPAALCYQRLQKDGQGAFTLHGLNAVYLPQHGWYRCDARGNKPGVDAQFTPPVERLAWSEFDTGEFDFTARYAEPVPAVVGCLTECTTYAQVYANLPDTLSLEFEP